MHESERGDVYSLDELITLYEFEAALRDLYVEGRSDAGFFTWYLGEHGLSADVYAIDDRVYLESGFVQSVGQEVNARGRAIAFAMACESRLGIDQRCVTVIVDADAANVVGPIPKCQCLLMTDDAALENYGLELRPMGKLLKVALGINTDPQAVIDAILPALRRVQSGRIVLGIYDIGVISDVGAVCTFKGMEGLVDVGELIRRSISGKPKAEWPKEINELEQLASDYYDMIVAANHSGRGHDIAPLICHSLAAAGIRVRENPKFVESALLGSLECQDIDDKPLFEKLRGRFAESAP